MSPTIVPKGAWFGWPDDPKIEELREAWFNARDREVQKKICREIQLQAFRNVPYYPVGAAWLARFPQGYQWCQGGLREILERPPHLTGCALCFDNANTPDTHQRPRVRGCTRATQRQSALLH